MNLGQTARRSPGTGALSLLEGYFRQTWDGPPMPDFHQRTRDGALYEIYECRACASLTTKPAAHAAWHESQKQKEPARA